MRLNQVLLIATLLFNALALDSCHPPTVPPACTSSGFGGRAFEREPTGAIGSTIPGVKITFIRENGDRGGSITTDSAGAYRISLCPGRYWVTATHQAFEDYSSVPGFFVVNGSAYSTGNVFLRQPRVTTILLLRHADRANDHLSPAGEERAKKLAEVARKTGVTAIYTTMFTRTQQTARPLADFLMTPIITYTSESSLVQQILAEHNGDVVLVVGHGDTVSSIAQSFGAVISSTAITDFDNLFVVTRRSSDGKVNAVNLQYGKDSSPDSRAANSYQMITLLLVRNSEGGDRGTNRAKDLTHVVHKAVITNTIQLYVTQQASSQEILQQLKDALDLRFSLYDPNDVQGFIDTVLSQHTGQLVVVAGEKVTLESMIRALGGSPYPVLFPDEYDNLYVITVNAPGEAKVINLQYGDPSP